MASASHDSRIGMEKSGEFRGFVGMLLRVGQQQQQNQVNKQSAKG
jgi:hypothetical protein